MTLEVIGVEGASAAIYLKHTLQTYSQTLATAADLVQDWHGLSQIEQKLDRYSSAGRAQAVFIVWDSDVFSRPGQVQAASVADHPLSFAFQPDFEGLFPDWMLAEALAIYDSGAAYPNEDEIRRSCRIQAPANLSFYQKLAACIKTHAQKKGQDPSTVHVPDKVKLAEALAKVAKRAWYQPEQMRRLCQLLQSLVPANAQEMTLTVGGSMSAPFKFNQRTVTHYGLTGRLLLSVIPDLWMIDLGRGTATKLVEGKVSGPASWSPDGAKVAIPSIPSHNIPNSEAIRVFDMASDILGTERLRVGHYLCWSKDGTIYANSLQSGGYQIHGIRPSDPSYRRVLKLPAGAIVSCIDRNRDRILIGDQSAYRGRRVLSIFQLNDGALVAEDVAGELQLAEWSAGAFSPDGRRISLPVEEGTGDSRASLYILDLDDKQGRRMTPPDGRVQSSCWSPDGTKVAFMWSRWPGDSVRTWVVDIQTRQLDPVVEGGFGNGALNALGCHSWADSNRGDRRPSDRRDISHIAY
ncbi:MAG: hypothetical protein Q7T26_01620 [Dehalococcoidia bacterium]|nr:hypothetical protein [Dehalococcoidia bacterium]